MPDPTRPDVSAATPIETQHITAECRSNKGPYVAWDHAVHLLRHVYEAQIHRDPEATISIAIYRTPTDLAREVAQHQQRLRDRIRPKAQP